MAQTRTAGKVSAAPKGKRKVQRFYDYSLLLAIVFITIFGLIMIFSSSAYEAQMEGEKSTAYLVKQGAIAFVGFFIMIFVSKVDYHFWLKYFTYPAYWSSYILMALTMWTPLGKEVNGKKRWFRLGPVSFQTTELVKVALIMFLAVYITKKGKKMNDYRRGLLSVFVWSAPLAVMVMENNLSSGIIVFGIAFVMAFISSTRKLPFYATAVVGVLGLIFSEPLVKVVSFLPFIKPYQMRRFYIWLDPVAYRLDGGFQTLQGLYAIGSGGLFGKGLGRSIQKLGFLPEAQNDMIFSIICEELGFIGAISILFIFLFMIYRFMVIASNAPDLVGSLLVIGVMAHISIQVILNVAVVTNVIPNTGITLPFISYGGTSILFLLAEMGLVLGVSNQIRLEH